MVTIAPDRVDWGPAVYSGSSPGHSKSGFVKQGGAKARPDADIEHAFARIDEFIREAESHLRPPPVVFRRFPIVLLRSQMNVCLISAHLSYG